MSFLAKARRTGLVTLAALALAIPGSLIGRASTIQVRSTIGIRWSKSASAFRGRVSSPRPICIGGRTVDLFEFFNGKNTLVGTTTTGAKGGWKISGTHAHGSFFTRVLRNQHNRYGTSLVCLVDRSVTIHVA